MGFDSSCPLIDVEACRYVDTATTQEQEKRRYGTIMQSSIEAAGLRRRCFMVNLFMVLCCVKMKYYDYDGLVMVMLHAIFL